MNMIKKLIAYVGEYKKASILAPLWVTGEVILEVLIPFLMSRMIDFGINNSDMGYIAKVGIVMVIAALLSLLSGVLSGKYAAFASAGFARNLRKGMYYKLQDFAFSDIDKFSTSSLVTRLTTDVTNVQNAYQMIIRVAVRSPMMLIFSLAMTVTISPKLSCIFLCILPFLGFGLYFIIIKAFPVFEKLFKTYDKLNQVIRENLRGMRVVKSFVREEYEADKFDGVAKEIYDRSAGAERILAFNAPLMQFAVYTAMILIAWFGAKMIVLTGETALTTGQLSSLFTYAMQILMSLMMFSMVFVMITMSKASITRISEVISHESSLTNGENPVSDVKDGSIEFENVSFSYKNDMNRLCLKNINLSVKSGETVGIIGATGSGKSSLVQLIPRLYDVTGGSVKVGGIDVRDYDITSLRNQVAVVLQKNVLFSGTIWENIRWGDKNASDEEVMRVCSLAAAHDFIMEFPDKYDTYIEQGGSNVSGGQKQRLCIARALLKKPKIIILDDSTSAVDTKTDALIRKAFREEIPDTTKIIIAQRISSVADADKIVVLNNGCIDAVGTHDELLKTNEIYREVYTSQVKGGDEQ